MRNVNKKLPTCSMGPTSPKEHVYVRDDIIIKIPHSLLKWVNSQKFILEIPTINVDIIYYSFLSRKKIFTVFLAHTHCYFKSHTFFARNKWGVSSLVTLGHKFSHFITIFYIIRMPLSNDSWTLKKEHSILWWWWRQF